MSTITKVVSITQLKQHSKEVIDDLNNNEEPVLLMQGKKVVAVLTPGKVYHNSELKRKNILKELDSMEQQLSRFWNGVNKNTTTTASEIDSFTF